MPPCPVLRHLQWTHPSPILCPSWAPPPTYRPHPPLLPPPHVILLLPSTTTHVLFQPFPLNPILLPTGHAITQSLLTLWNAQRLHPILPRPLPRKLGGISRLRAHSSLCRASCTLLTFPNPTAQSPAMPHLTPLRQHLHQESGRPGGDFRIYFPGPSAHVALLTLRLNPNRLKRPQAQRAKTKKSRVLLAKPHRSNLCRMIRPSPHHARYRSPLRVLMSSAHCLVLLPPPPPHRLFRVPRTHS